MGSGSVTVMHRHHPWRALRALTGWTLHWADLGDPDLLGVTDYQARTITLASGMTQAQRRSTIAHEVAHVERGPVPAHLEAREEVAVDVLAARRLITLEMLADGLRWARSVHELAEELWVDEAMVEVRLRHLHPSERHFLERTLGHEHAAH